MSEIKIHAGAAPAPLPVELDAIDHRLLDLLQADASRTNHALAEAAQISPATALRRARRLVEAGLTAISEISLDAQGAEHLEAFEARAIADKAIQQCYRVSPGPDFVLVAWVPDMAAWSVVVQRLFTQDANVRNVKTYFSVKRAKFEP